MPKIYQRYATISRQLPKANICQGLAKDMPGVIMRLQIQDNYLKQGYTKDSSDI